MASTIRTATPPSPVSLRHLHSCVEGTSIVVAFAAPALDSVPPLVGNFSPIPGSPVTPATALEFDITDETGLRRVLLMITYPSGEREIAFDASGFTAPYVANSSRAEIAGGYRYTLRRTAGWPATPTLIPYAIDTAGNEAP